MNLLPIVCCWWLSLAAAVAQPATATLTGRVTDAETGQPLPLANVYLNTTTRGTVCDRQGNYRLEGVPTGTVNLVASFVGYESLRKTVRIENNRSLTVNLALKPTGLLLTGVTVKARRDKTWERNFRVFERELLGNTPFRSQCRIANGEVVRFTEEDGHLRAQASEPLIIDNLALGYQIRFDLQHFDFYKGRLYYAGNSQFEEQKPTSEAEAARWQRNRQTAYQGSVRHLIASLIAGTWEQEGFLVYAVNPKYPFLEERHSLQYELGRRLLPVTTEQLFRPGRLPFERYLVSEQTLEVYYMRIAGRSRYRDAPFAYSLIEMPRKQAEVTTDGRVTLPNGMEVKGYLGNDRLSILLPADWNLPAPAALLTEGQLLPADYRLDSLRHRWRDFHDRAIPAIFLPVDKPFYLTGDTLWFSAYVFDETSHQLLPGDYALQVDLLAPDGAMVRHQWLRIENGRAAGDFRLSDSLASGLYRLRAYTGADQPDRPSFERLIPVYNAVDKSPPGRVTSITDSLDIQFLPEGGRWVAGLPARLAFKAVGSNGSGRRITGRIMDDQSTEVVRFVSNQVGMGSVEWTPQPDRTYRAEVQWDNRRQMVPLPIPEAVGLVLGVETTADSSQLVLRIRATGPDARYPVYVTVQSRGQLIQRKKLGLNDGKGRIYLPTAELPEGICQITLFDGQGRPRCERLVFVPERSARVQVRLQPDKASYQPREQVRLRVSVSDPTPTLAYLSASVTDAGQLPADTAAADLRAYLLLTGHLRGRVESPGLYFRDASPATRRALDDLLLTQGWRRVGWEAMDLRPKADTVGGIVLTGRVMDLQQKPIPNAELMVSAFARGGSFTRSVSANDRGVFRLVGLNIPDTVRLVVQVMNYQFKAIPARVILDAPAAGVPLPVADPDWSAWQAALTAARLRQAADSALHRDRHTRLLKEVTVRGYKTPTNEPDNRTQHGPADVTLTFDERSPRFPNLYEMLIGRLGVQVARNSGGGYVVNIRGAASFVDRADPLYLVDGLPIQENPEGNVLMSFSPEDVARIEILKNAPTAGFYGLRGGNGVIAFYTRRGKSDQPAPPGPGLALLKTIGFVTHREFYTPHYDEAGEPPARTDRRDVLFWKPLMQTDSQGQATLAFPLSDVARTLRIVIQGITADGRPVVAVQEIRGN